MTNYIRRLLTFSALAIATVRSTYVDIVNEHHHANVAAEGEPRGKLTKIGGVDTYVTLPNHVASAGKAKEALLFLTDIYGLPLVNSKLLADQFASKGIATFIPDYLNGDPVPLNNTGFNMTEWRTRHTEADTLPPLYNVIEGLKSFGVKRFAATGYCFGGLYVLRLAQNDDILVGTTAHPSGLRVPEDFLLLREQSSVPIQIHSAQNDGALTPALASIVDDVLYGTGNYTELEPYGPGYERVHHQGVGHGFAVRPSNATDPIQIAAKEAALESAAAWVREHL